MRVANNPWRERLAVRELLRQGMCPLNSAPSHFVSIRAIRLLLAIPEHEVSQQACRSEWQVGLDFSLAYRRADPNSSASFSAPRLHLISVLEEVRREFLSPWRLEFSLLRTGELRRIL